MRRRADAQLHLKLSADAQKSGCASALEAAARLRLSASAHPKLLSLLYPYYQRLGFNGRHRVYFRYCGFH